MRWPPAAGCTRSPSANTRCTRSRCWTSVAARPASTPPWWPGPRSCRRSTPAWPVGWPGWVRSAPGWSRHRPRSSRRRCRHWLLGYRAARPRGAADAQSLAAEGLLGPGWSLGGVDVGARLRQIDEVGLVEMRVEEGPGTLVAGRRHAEL